MLWTDQYKYSVYDQGWPREMLVDLKSDPGEMRNLAMEPEYDAVVARCRELLKQWYADNGEQLDARYVVPRDRLLDSSPFKKSTGKRSQAVVGDIEAL